ncbi:AlpA family transcriptional regulator [Rhodobacter aestuarii]|uniref:Transcriptional regulator, AlpA family n=1 Tax=Rhodobacter aestuarii TaxID=453582 RepID=A0A1N7M7G7_9RHOB|nr:hypothetical protein [Rhodobacter aestuarii]PTV94900.1 AlpA family transcriptional regulator [Rhodobacter aestuarii]SIS82066.1 transcriptional regulator, AlpA family [Rhodobacter aestuarii]
MGRHDLRILYATDRTAAKLLDMKPAEFRDLVEVGALPAPLKIGTFERWSIEEINAIVQGTKPKPTEEFEL